MKRKERLTMYTVAVKRDFVAQHFLIGGDWGAENFEHSHHYAVEVRLEGEALNRHGYLVDIVDIENNLNALVSRFRDKLLNDEPEFAGLNPSIENFSHILWRLFSSTITAPNIVCVTVVLWENEIAWASYRSALKREKSD
jgi:6-pyruvoyltetrahydropterin/6-carboxytetrahydropterin synthase